MEKTLSIVKPDAVSKNVIGKIISRFEENNLYLVAGKLVHLSDDMASGFYAEHEGRPFFKDLKSCAGVNTPSLTDACAIASATGPIFL